MRLIEVKEFFARTTGGRPSFNYFVDEDDDNRSIEASEPSGEGAVDVDGADDSVGNIVDGVVGFDSGDGPFC